MRSVRGFKKSPRLVRRLLFGTWNFLRSVGFGAWDFLESWILEILLSGQWPHRRSQVEAQRSVLENFARVGNQSLLRTEVRYLFSGARPFQAAAPPDLAKPTE